MSPTDKEIISGAFDGGTEIDSQQGCVSVVKARFVSTGISFSRLASGGIGVSIHEGEKAIGLAMSKAEAAELAAKVARLAVESEA